MPQAKGPCPRVRGDRVEIPRYAATLRAKSVKPRRRAADAFSKKYDQLRPRGGPSQETFLVYKEYFRLRQEWRYT
jgi:hypothetical protein